MTTASDLLDEARALAIAGHSNPVRRRTVVGRAYYAAFHHLLEIAKRQFGYRYDSPGAKNKRFGVHRHLIEYLGKCADADLRFAAELLDKLRSHRITADYALYREIEYSDMTAAIEYGTHIIEEITATAGTD